MTSYTSMRRDDVASTSIRRHFGTLCPLGIYLCIMYFQPPVIVLLFPLCVSTIYMQSVCPPSKFLQVLNNQLHGHDTERHQYGTCSPVLDGPYTPDNLLALCAWDMVPDYDEYRYPHTILVAQCRCRTCLKSFKCKPVYVQKEVIHYQCVNGTMTWTKSLQYFPSSCVCVRPSYELTGRRRK